MEGRVIAITGGAGGIGLATAKLLASRGAKLSLADVSQEQLDKAVVQIKEAVSSTGEIFTQKCDVRDLSQVEDWIKQTVDKLGKLDGACNLAGTVGPKPCLYSMDEEDEEIWDFIIGVNLTVSLTCVLCSMANRGANTTQGVMHCIKTEVKYMKAGGSIVNAASVAGQTGAQNMAVSVYCAA